MPQHLEDKAQPEKEPMLWIIKIIGFAIWIGVLSMMIAAVFFRNGTEKDVTLVYVAIMDFAVIAIVVRAILKRTNRSIRG